MEQNHGGTNENGATGKVDQGYISRNKELKSSRLRFSKCEFQKTLNNKNLSKYCNTFRKKRYAFRNLKVDYNVIRDSKLPRVFKILSNIHYLQTAEITYNEKDKIVLKAEIKQSSNRKHLYGILNQSAIYLTRALQETAPSFSVGMNKLKRHLDGLNILIHPYHSLNFFVVHHEIPRFLLLRHLKINLMGGERGTLIKEMVRNIFKFRNLEDFNINLREVNDVSQECLMLINWYIARMKKLRTLEYHIGGSAQNVVTDFSERISKLPFLKEMCVDFLTWDKTTESNLVDFVQNVSNSSKLETLGLSFYFYIKHPNNSNLNILIGALNLLKNIKSLSLQFRSCSDITDEALANIGKQLFYFKNLESLQLSFLWCKPISDVGIENLCNSLATFTSLSCLKLEFECCAAVTDRSLKALSGLISSLPNLTRLYINFASCPNLSDEGLLLLAKSIITRKKLINLFLYFSSSVKITESGRGMVSDYVKRSKQYICTKLIFLDCGRKETNTVVGNKGSQSARGTQTIQQDTRALASARPALNRQETGCNLM